MKNLRIGLLTVLAAIAAGCNQNSTPGGPGVSNVPRSTSPDAAQPNSTTVSKPVLGEAENTFEMSVPVLATRVKQGASSKATINVSRGKNFAEDVMLQFVDLPFGITVEQLPVTIMHDQKGAEVVFHAATDAAIGDFTLKVIGHPTKGADATNELKIVVVENK